ncbi:cytoplasmic protein [Saitoella complicata NRRL Y-17804]|uniref:Cytoplasmic protein n=1 Tax=Saitoella complicata (strain BCRC 22490 / CBS 7301 / JCM 7358 / NBRC 10748 / NRRL Y-17804) TaxID=698492 RepID=A0A0E9NJS0_SAICN|nr:cytoplasmic protein [Saitoella complicata NRRL Y-17804]ODQ55079.1 cytoplasmic protein [Saitoella complicata NRRL Y-17804]GAO50053.1 hypothetical protein G7K_4188-t1 [Saitoella complicata NRRL Y-17804]
MSSDPLTSTTRPVTDAVVTVRVIKSFPHRTVKNMILPHVDLTAMTVGDLKEIVRSEVQKQGGWKPYRSCVAELDTLKIYTQPHATKTMNLIINMDNEHWMLDDESKKLVEYGFANETEVSFFNRVGYEEFKANPEEKWL